MMASRSSLKQAHPRTRGEYLINDDIDWLDVGSPPHTRGILYRHPEEARQGRLTPAHAGNTPVESGELYAIEAHPRTRGEYSR